MAGCVGCLKWGGCSLKWIFIGGIAQLVERLVRKKIYYKTGCLDLFGLMRNTTDKILIMSVINMIGLN
jgi:hypothetical protein